MALVAYDNSDSSEFEDDQVDTAPVVTLIHKNEVPEAAPSQCDPNDDPEESHTLFNFLPKPSSKKPAVIEEDDEFLHKKETAKDVVKPKAKITVPSLSDFKDVEDKPAVKPRVDKGKKSGLLNLLPQPKNARITATTTSLIPHALKRKPLVPTTVKKKEPFKRSKTEAKGLVTSYSDESDDDEDTNDFFSINKPVELPIVDTELDIDMPVQPKQMTEAEIKAARLQSFFKKDVPEQVEMPPDNAETTDSILVYSSSEPSSSENNGYVPIENNELELDEEAIRQLCGTRSKRKREEIQIVDINQQEVLADARQWLMKGLMDDTTKRVSSSKKTGHEPTSQQRRKHQITYLAHQAKANEAELQNQWANNRMSKRQTQSKYGF